MATIVTRASKGSALTWTEGDANITNLNNDKIELTDLSVSTGTASGGGSLSYNNTTGEFTFAPADVSGGASSLNDLSDVDYSGVGISDGDILVWNSLTSTFGNAAFSLINESIGDLSDVDTSGATVGGEVLTYNSGTSTWEAQTPSSGLTSISEDMMPQLGGSLDVNGYSITSASNGDITISPDGTGVTNLNRIVYNETIYSLGTTDTPTVDPGNGNVQSVTITSGLTLPTFEGETAGQSVTLLVSGSGTASGTANHKFAGGNTTLTTLSVISIFYDGTNYWTSIATDFQ